MTKKILFSVMVLMLVSVVAFAGDQKEYKVAYIVADLENPFWKATADGFEDTAKELGLTPRIFNSGGQVNTQMKNVQDCITLGYSAVVIAGTDSSSASAPVKALNEVEIPVWILHIKPDDPKAAFVSMVDAQNEGGNYDAGQYIAEKYKAMGLTGKAAEITISLARSNGAARHRGMKRALDEAGIPLEMSEVREATKYTRDEAYKFAQDLLTANPDLSVLWCNYDEAVLGAMKAVQDAGRADQIILGGFDGSPESLKAVQDGKITVMAIQPAYKHGSIVAEQMFNAIVKGETVESNSTPCPLVTIENAEKTVPTVLHDTYGPDA